MLVLKWPLPDDIKLDSYFLLCNAIQHYICVDFFNILKFKSFQILFLKNSKRVREFMFI